MKHNLRILSVTLILFILSCGKMNTMGTQDSTGLGPVPVPLGQAFAIGEPAPQSVNLSGLQEFSVAVTAANDFAGQISLTIDRSELDLVDATSSVTIQVIPNLLNLAPAETKTISVRIESRSDAPDYNDHFHIIGTEVTAAPSPKEAVAMVAFRVNPLIEIDLHGGPSPEVFTPMFSTVSIKAHVGGVTVRYVNYDRVSTHIIHGTGAIPHQSTASPLATATATAPGGTYEFKVTSMTPSFSGQFYCHSHESGAQARTIIFNAP